MGYYCTVPQCTSLAGKTKNVKFHKFPSDAAMQSKWNEVLKRGKPVTVYSKVCSLHFTQADYNVTTMGQWKTLNKDAVPSQNLPKLNPDGTVMVIRKSRTVKYKEAKKTENKSMKTDKIWPVSSPNSNPAVVTDIPQICTEQDANPYKMQYISSLATITPNTQNRPKKQDAIMQTDPEDENITLPYKEDEIPQTTEDYNLGADKYALERKIQFEKQDYEKYRQELYYQDVKCINQMPERSFFNEQEIKQEIDISIDDDSYLYDRKEAETDPIYDDQRQRIIEHIQNQVKQEPDVSNVCNNVCLQSQTSPYYQNGHNVYYDQMSRPGPELLIAKQNALAAHTQLWQNTVKRPFYYSDNSHYTGPPLLHRYNEDLSRILQ